MLRRLIDRNRKAAKRLNEAIEILRNSNLLDPVWYRQTYADLRDTPVDVARHYIEHGAKEGRNPHPLFDTNFYLEQNPDVAASGMNPLVHYILYGAKEGRDPQPAFNEKQQDQPALTTNDDKSYQLNADIELIKSSDLFDENFYLDKNPDVKSAKIDALMHYVNHGAKEGREPSALFSSAKYLKQNADVREMGLNPLAHWLRHGRSEQRPFPHVEKGNYRELAYYCSIDILEDQYIKYFSEDFLISVITPAYNTDPKYLLELLFSLQNQRYSNWEWVVVDDGSINLDTINQLKLMAKKEPRLKVVYGENRGISAASNMALSIAQGTHVALIDHDDLISRDAFFLIWEQWKIAPHTALFYTDECKLSEQYELYDYMHKPAWSPIYLENTMYIGHLSVYRADIIKEAGGLRSQFDGTQDFDLALRVSASTKDVCHIAEICYFWRAIEGSAAATLDAKSYALERQLAAVLEHAQNKNLKAEVRAGWAPGFWYIDYPLKRPPPLVSYVIPTAARRRVIRDVETDLLEQCIRSLEAKEFYPHREYVVVHNGDLSQSQMSFLATIDSVVLVEYKPKNYFNFSEKLNQGVRQAKGEYLCILNDDIEIITCYGGMSMVGFLESNPEAGAISSICLFEDGRIQHNGIVLTSHGPTHSGIFKEAQFGGSCGYLRCRREAFGVTGALMFTKKAHYDAVGGFSEIYPCNYNDVDFCLKLRAIGLSCVVDPYISVYHFEASSKIGTFSCERQRFYVEWPGLNDPYFNKNFLQSNPFYELDLTQSKPLVRIENAPSLFEPWLVQEICRRSRSYPSSGKCKLTVGVSIYDEPPHLLNEMLTSFLMQTYANKELVVIDNGSTNPSTLKWIRELESSRLATIVRHKVNQGIAGANRAIVAAMTGDFLLPVDADDFWTVDALMVMAGAIEAHPEARIFYSDEFKSDGDSRQFSPFFKPDFDPVLLTNCCYPAHLMAMQRELLHEIDAYSDNRTTWCHDYDTLTRALPLGFKPVHVPELLYAWRIRPGSTAAAGHEAKPQTIESQRFALQRLLDDLGKRDFLEIEHNPLFFHPGMWRLKHKEGVPLPDVKVLVSTDFHIHSGERSLDELRVLAHSAECPDWIAILGHAADSRIILSELFAIALLDSGIVVASGLICDANEKIVLWSGGFFTSENTIIDPYTGSPLTNSGYHGQLYCQRCIDVPAPINILIKKDFLNRALTKFEPKDYQTLMIALGVEAMVARQYIAVTPHVRYLLPDRGTFAYPHDREGVLERIGGPKMSSRWYNPKLPTLKSQAYTITDKHRNLN